MGRKSRAKRERTRAPGAAPAPAIPKGDPEFLRQLIAHDEGEYDRVPLEVLRERGKVYASAERLTDAEVTRELWRLIEDLASLGIYLTSTDHLSDRELYEKLAGEMLLESMAIDPEGGCCTWLDPIGGFSEEDLQIYYRYYADEETMTELREENPDESFPPRETPPYERDRFLPSGEPGAVRASRDS